MTTPREVLTSIFDEDEPECDSAADAADVMIEALKVRGFVIVPVEPTKAMVRAWRTARTLARTGHGRLWWRRVLSNGRQAMCVEHRIGVTGVCLDCGHDAIGRVGDRLRIRKPVGYLPSCPFPAPAEMPQVYSTNDGTQPLEVGQRIRLPVSYAVRRNEPPAMGLVDFGALMTKQPWIAERASGERLLEAMGAIGAPAPTNGPLTFRDVFEKLDRIGALGPVDNYERALAAAPSSPCGGALGSEWMAAFDDEDLAKMKQIGPGRITYIGVDMGAGDSWSVGGTIDSQITPDMKERGALAIARSKPTDSFGDTACAVFRAMMAAVSDDFYGNYPPRWLIGRMVAEKDAALASADQHLRERNNIFDEATRYVLELNHARQQLAARDATIADLNTRLAQFTAANVAPADPKPVHDPFKHRERDPRRMGPEGI